MSRRVIMTLYMCLPTLAFTYVFVTQNIPLLLIIMAVAAVIWYALSGPVFKGIGKIVLKPAQDVSASRLMRIYVLSAGLCMLMLLVWLIAFFPGSYFADSVEQYRQAVTGSYSDWHPAWHTMCFFTLPLKLTGGAVWSIVAFQMLVFSLAVGYMSVTVFRYAGTVPALIAWAYIVLNPYTGLVLLYPLKDIPFAIAGGVSMLMVARIVCEDGYLTRTRCFIIGFMIAQTALFRHNGIIFSVILVIVLFAVIGTKRFMKWLCVTIAFLCTFLVIRGPVYDLAGVRHEPQSVMQAVGLPMAIIGNVTVETPELLDDETAEFVYSIAPQSEWDAAYELGNFGIMKYFRGLDLSVVEDTGVMPIVKMAGRCVMRSPGPSLRAALELTDIVYGWDILDQEYMGPQIVDNDMGLKTRWNESLGNLLITYYKLVRMHGYDFFRQSAFALILMLAFALAGWNIPERTGWKGVLLVLPVFAYDFGTMLLLTSPDARFFYITYLVCPAALLISLVREKPSCSAPV